MKEFNNSREKLYTALAESQAVKERAPLTLVSLVVKIGNAMVELAREKGVDLVNAAPPLRSKLLQAVFEEFNQHGWWV